MPLIRANNIEDPITKESIVSYPEYPNFGYSHFVTIILNLDSIRFHYLNRWLYYQNRFNLSLEVEDDLYDWLVNEAFNNVCRLNFQARVSSHYRHDVYKCIYDEVGQFLEASITQQIKIHKLHFLKGQNIKTLVAGNSLFIAKGVIPRA